MLLILITSILVTIISLLPLIFKVNKAEKKSSNYDKFFHNETFEKIDKLTEGLGEYRPDKIIVGSHYWDKIPNMLKYEPIWERNGKKAYPLSSHSRSIKTFKEKPCVDYKGMKVILDSDNKYKFDIE